MAPTGLTFFFKANQNDSLPYIIRYHSRLLFRLTMFNIRSRIIRSFFTVDQRDKPLQGLSVYD